MKSSKNKIIFLLIALVIYLMWMTILIISLHNGYLKALIALLCFITYVFIGSHIFYTINCKHYKGLCKHSKSDNWFNTFMCWLIWPAAIIDLIKMHHEEN